MFKVFIYFLGLIFTSVGIFFTLIYLNLLTIGYNLGEFVHFISRKLEFWFIPLGLLLIIFSVRKVDKK